MILDSNVIIYLSNGFILNEALLKEPFAVSCISKLEVLGFHRITDSEKEKLEKFFFDIRIFNLNDLILNEAIRIRQMRKMSLGDSIIAATALVHRLPLLTANTEDFRWIDGLEIINPLEQ